MDEKNGNTLVVSPVAKRAVLKPGETYTSSIKVVNASSSKGPVRYKVSAVPYSVVDEEYTADFATVGTYSKISEWVELDKTEGVLEPGKFEEINYSIVVPEDAENGGQYCAIVVQNVPDENSADGFTFKFGAEKGRVATIILSLIIFSLVMFLTQFSRPEIPEDFLLFLENFFPLISLLISAGLFTVSYFISKKIYKNKEF